jgi:hypothetical protein
MADDVKTCKDCKVALGYRPILDVVELCPRHAALPEWRPIETAPIEESVLIYVPNAEHYGDPIYRALQIRNVSGGGTHWQTTGIHHGRDLNPHYGQPTHWMPLPDPPETKP